MHELPPNDSGQPPSIFEVQDQPFGLEELSEASCQVTPLSVPVGEHDDLSAFPDEVVGSGRERPAAMDLDDPTRKPEAAQGGAVSVALDDHHGPLLGALPPESLPQTEEVVEGIDGSVPVAHCRGVPHGPGGPLLRERHREGPIVLVFSPEFLTRFMPDHYTQLLEWRRNEAAVRGLAKIPHDFYRATSVYLGEVRRSYESELRENPSGRKGEISRQTYQRASQISRDIVEARTQKVLTAAFQASIGGTRELTNALAEERAVFDTVLATLSEHRRLAAPYLEGMIVAPAPVAPTPAPPQTSEPASRPAEPSPSVPAARPARPTPPLTYVRVLKSGRPISVGSETVDLRADDILSLPADAAKLLIDAKVAEPVATGPVRPVT